MGKSITFRLNPKHAEDREIIEWLAQNADSEGGQTALVKAALLSAIHGDNEKEYHQRVLEEIKQAISMENETFSQTVAEVVQGMVNQMFAGSIAMLGQGNVMQMGGQTQVIPAMQMQQSSLSVGNINAQMPQTLQSHQLQPEQERELQADTTTKMDNDTRNALGSLFDDD